MTTPTTTPARKLIDVEKILAVIDAEPHLIHGALVEPVFPEATTFTEADLSAELAAQESYSAWVNSTKLPEPGPLALAACEHAGRCAMGALFLATGKISPKELSDMDGAADGWTLPQVKLLYDTYGIQRYHAEVIIGANDTGHLSSIALSSIADRRKRVKDAVVRLAELQITSPERDIERCRDTERERGGYDIAERFKALDLGHFDYDSW